MCCSPCLQNSHQHLPLHLVQEWNGTYFQDTTLRREGLVVNMGHSGGGCPLTPEEEPATEYLPHPGYNAYATSPASSPAAETPEVTGDAGSSQPATDAQRDAFQSPPRKRRRKDKHRATVVPQDTDLQDKEDEEDENQWEDVQQFHPDGDLPTGDEDIFRFAERLKKPAKYDSAGNSIVTVVDVTGIHFIAVHYCKCPDAPPKFEQILRMGWYPATRTDPQTIFTQDVLDDYLLQNRECHTTTANYYAKLRRQTSDLFPQLIPVSSRTIDYCSY